MQFTARRLNSGSTALIIRAEDIGNAPAITTATNNLSNRTSTTASVAWSPAAWTGGNAGVDQQSPDISTVVQAVVDRGDWSSGNSLLFTITGTGLRRAHAYNSNPALAPELIVEYTGGAQ